MLDSKWFLKELGADGLHKMLVGFENKSAQAICTFAYSEGPGHAPILFQGRTAVCFSVHITSASPLHPDSVLGETSSCKRTGELW